jgi:hypothetical protein
VLAVLQARLEPRFVKADLALETLEIAREAVLRTEGAYLVEAEARFARANLDHIAGEALLIEIVVAGNAGARPNGVVESEIASHVTRLVSSRMTGVVPFVRTTVLAEPAGTVP